MKFVPLFALLILTACGADGAPKAPASGVTVSGEAQMGVTTAETPEN